MESILFLLDVLNNKEISKRDALKNAALEKAHIPLLRLSTDGSNERERLLLAGPGAVRATLHKYVSKVK